MELLNISFLLLILKIAVCVISFIFGIFLIASPRETKRKMRDRFCHRVFGASKAIPSYKFVRFIYFVGALLLLFSMAASWFLVLKAYV